MKRILLLCLLVAATARASSTATFKDLVGTTGTFSGQVTSNGANVLTASSRNITQMHWVRNNTSSANVILNEFTTGDASTLTDLIYSTYVNSATTTGTMTFSVTTTAAAVLCSVSYNCATTPIGTLATGQTACSNALAANTKYQVRYTSNCATGSVYAFLSLSTKVTTP